MDRHTYDAWERHKAKKEDHAAAVRRYHAARDEWDRLSPEEQEARNAIAEDNSLKAWSVVAALVSVGVAAYFLKSRLSHDNFVYAVGAMLILTPAIFYFLRRVVGRSVRGISFAGLIGGGTYGASLLAFKLLEHPPPVGVAYAIGIAGCGAGVVLEILGKFRSSAAPRHPGAAPEPPSAAEIAFRRNLDR